jgi:hypothetical protein
MYTHNNTLYKEMKGRQDCRASGLGFQMNSLYKQYSIVDTITKQWR